MSYAEEQKNALSLLNAIKNENLNLIKKILLNDNDSGFFDVNFRHPTKQITALEYAIERDSASIVDLLLKHRDINVNTTDNPGFNNTPLMLALSKNEDDIVRLLYNHKNIDINKRNAAGHTPLIYSVILERLNLVKILLGDEHRTQFIATELCNNEMGKYGPDPNNQYNLKVPTSMIHFLFSFIKPKALENIDKNATIVKQPGVLYINAQFPEGSTALSIAIQIGNVEIVDQLLQEHGIIIPESIGTEILDTFLGNKRVKLNKEAVSPIRDAQIKKYTKISALLDARTHTK